MISTPVRHWCRMSGATDMTSLTIRLRMTPAAGSGNWLQPAGLVSAA